ncbi:MAG: hypothetical protein LBG49_01995 [Mycoplasmataceae bacterium]|nr:hypothetical protein [Mycoplasmataceae bacterium]
MAKTFIYKTVNQAHINELFKLEPLLQRYLNINTPITFRLMPDHYKCLIHSIISQQLNSAAVDAIWNKLVFSFKKLKPKIMQKATVEQLTGIGLTETKAKLIVKLTKDICNNILSLKKLEKKSNSEIIEILTKYEGIGEWTVNMLLIFTYYRNDVLPTNDKGVRDGLDILYEGRAMSRDNFVNLHKFLGNHATMFTICLWYIKNNHG